MDELEHITVRRADGYWSVLGQRHIKGSHDVDQLLAALERDGWTRTEGGSMYSGRDLMRVKLERRMPEE